MNQWITTEMCPHKCVDGNGDNFVPIDVSAVYYLFPIDVSAVYYLLPIDVSAVYYLLLRDISAVYYPVHI